jgi:hypothetical protein
VQLGNIFLNDVDWAAKYKELLQKAGDLLTQPLFAPGLPTPICLLCAEKDPAQCHRGLIATFLERKGHATVHIM